MTLSGCCPPMRAAHLLAVIFLILQALALAGCTLSPHADGDAPPPEAADPAIIAFFSTLQTGREVRFETSHGEIRMLLFESHLPVTTARFAELVAGRFYDGTSVHRIVPRFVVQGGDPTGSGLMGSGEAITHERHPDLLFASGAIGLARGLEEDSGDSQWFITLTPQPHLSDPGSDTAQLFGTYALFAQVTSGMDAVRAMAQETVVPGLDRPIDPPVVTRATLHPFPADLDLLALPLTLQPRAALGAHRYDLEHPHHVFSGHAFPIGVHLRPGDDSAPPPHVLVSFTGSIAGDGGESLDVTAEIILDPIGADPWSFATTTSLPHAGTWRLEVGLPAGTAAAPVAFAVEPWHADYDAFSGTSP
jgi:cyclophilin family peptidyl-prolyl cis-trans isomerase